MSVFRAHILGQAAPSRAYLTPAQTACTQQACWQLGILLSRPLVLLDWHASGHRSLASQATGSNGAGSSDRDGSGGAVAVAASQSLGRVLDTELRLEVEKSYLSYAMSVIVGRALPDVRDGLKPVHRRILFAMHDLGLLPSRPFRKSARVVGEVLGKYHPHGDTAVYDALVRLAQPFSMRLPLVDGHGNFGSQDRDPAAAMRYTECRLQPAATSALLADLELDTVDFLDTFDGSQQEPAVLPARLPNLLINGSQGIAVGMATNIPPHNVREVVRALEAVVDNADVDVAELMTHIPGPDFPTGGEIVASVGIKNAYASGRGQITVRGKATVEGEEAAGNGSSRGQRRSSARPAIVISELPFQTNKAGLVEHIAHLTDAGTLQGISDVRDESDRDGMRVVVELKRGVSGDLVLNNLYKHTALQKAFSCNLVALVDGGPQTLGLKDFLVHFLAFRCRVVSRRAAFELGRAERRAHIVDGLLAAQGQLDGVVAAIRAAQDGPAAAAALRDSFGLSSEQAEAVLGMALRRMTSLEAGKLRAEQDELQSRIADLRALLGSEQAIRQTVVREASQLAETLGDERRTLVRRDVDGLLQQEDIIPNRQSLIVFSRRGYIKRMAADFFSTQLRGGKGQKVASLRDNDFVEEVQVVRDHQSILFFTTDGQSFAVKAYEIPQASRTAAGTALPQVLKVSRSQKVTGMVPVDRFSDEAYLVLLTKHGWVKRVSLSVFAKLRPGSTAIKLEDGDELIWVRLCRADDDVMLATTDGTVVRYAVAQIRPMGRAARGVAGIRLGGGAEIVGLTVLPHQGDDETSSGGESDEDGDDSEGSEEPLPAEGLRILFATERGYGKQVPAELFRTAQSRGVRGVRGIRLLDGDRLAAFHVTSGDEEEVLLSTSNGLITRIPLESVAVQSRTARGVILMRTKDEGDKINTVTLIGAGAEGQ